MSARTDLWRAHHYPQAIKACNEHGVKLLYLVVSGSHAYGTETPESDVDVRGVFLPGKQHVFGTRRIREISFGEDGKIHELRSYLSKLEAGTPNLLDWLFVPTECILYMDPLFKPVMKHRFKFVTKRLHKRLGGYAIGQLKKMGNATRESGEKRKALIAKHGYDTKNAMHLLRLLMVGHSVFAQGIYPVRMLPWECDYLQQVRRGEFSLDMIKASADTALRLMDEAFAVTGLEDAVDPLDVDKLAIATFLEAWEI